MDKFFCNWVEGTNGGFHHKHTTLEKARQEAERLARLPANKGRKVYVMELVTWCDLPEKPVEWHDVEE